MSINEGARSLVPCLLEIIKALEAKSRPIRLMDIAGELKRPAEELKRALDTGLREGLIEVSGGVVKLTDKGFMEVQKHRESYVHKAYAHRPRLLGSFLRFLEGRVENWRVHWRHRHGFDESSLSHFYKDLQSLQGRIEETIPLANLRQGERGAVAYMLGGRGLTQRLAEMGLTPGTEIIVIRHAPLGGPIEIAVRGVSLALGHGVASKIFVKPSR